MKSALVVLLLLATGPGRSLAGPPPSHPTDRPLPELRQPSGKPVVPIAPVPLVLLVPPSGEPDVRIRGTGFGTLLGGSIGGSLGFLVGLILCNLPATDHGPEEGCRIGEAALATAVGLSSGALLGGTLGAGLPAHRRAGYQPRVWERASGEIGTLALRFGGTRVLGEQNVERFSQALGGAFLFKLGPYFAFGPEVANYKQRRRDHRFEPVAGSLPREPQIYDANVMAWTVQLRAGWPRGDLYPYLLTGYGAYDDLRGDFAGNLGAGAEWRLRAGFALGAETRVHGGLDGAPTAFVTLSAGASWHW